MRPYYEEMKRSYFSPALKEEWLFSKVQQLGLQNHSQNNILKKTHHESPSPNLFVLVLPLPNLNSMCFIVSNLDWQLKFLWISVGLFFSEAQWWSSSSKLSSDRSSPRQKHSIARWMNNWCVQSEEIAYQTVNCKSGLQSIYWLSLCFQLFQQK